jgi:uncharacterized protein DUF6941
VVLKFHCFRTARHGTNEDLYPYFVAGASPIPTLLAFIVCDTVIQDAATQKRTLVGVFDRLMSPALPVAMNVGLYAKMVDGDGPYEIKIRMVNLKDESPVFEGTLQAQWQVAEDPLEVALNLQGVPITEFGTYEFQLYANDVFLGRTVIKVQKFQPPVAPGPAHRGN